MLFIPERCERTIWLSSGKFGSVGSSAARLEGGGGCGVDVGSVVGVAAGACVGSAAAADVAAVGVGSGAACVGSAGSPVSHEQPARTVAKAATTAVTITR